MSIKIDLTWIVSILVVFGLLQCDRKINANRIKECIKGMPADICLRINKGI